jgi:hypothetical protein
MSVATINVSPTMVGAIHCGVLVGVSAVALMLPGCGEGDNPFPDRLFNVTSVKRAANDGEHVEETVRLWANPGPSEGAEQSRFGSRLVEDPIETATVDIGQLSLEVLFAYSKGPRTHVGFLVRNDTSMPIQLRWSGLTLTPRAFSWGLRQKATAAGTGKQQGPQAMYLDVNGGERILIDQGYPRDYTRANVSQDAFWLRRLRGCGEYVITTESTTQLEVPPQSEGVLAACFRCNKIKKADVDVGLLINGSDTDLTFELAGE